ncbi:Putative extracellular membrane protein, CFEM [Septoria linicola]|uniref:Extracellular membrane protein, CFEM n=1 Tax=Septoria linicola TaxID=215465 RepID=A0A9Q9B2V8_9PEZI|nr:putative extracellular membrane protein, CFEM [Septoria linicola]USW55346.1 Putative extracellular membrane protein, CFEM [Septoria linicola]
MHSFLASILAAASLAAAATTAAPSDSMPDLSKVPQCALRCLTEAAGSTSCSLEDAYCQCTTGAADIVKVIVPCLCQSACTPQDLISTLAASTEICATALKAHGEEFKAPAASPDICKAFTGGAGTPPSEEAPKESPPSDQTGPEPSVASPPSGYAPNTNMTPHSPSGYGPNATNTSTGQTPGTSGIQQSTGGAAGVEVGMRMVGTMVLIGLVGAGVAAL